MQRRGMDDRVLNILVVDDDAVDVLNVKRAFEKAHLTNPIFVATNGGEALEMLKTGRIPERRVVLLDLAMPRIDGVELLRAMRRDPMLRTTTVIVLTTSPEDRDRIEHLQLDVAGYLQKPISFTTFAEVMAALNKCWTLTEGP